MGQAGDSVQTKVRPTVLPYTNLSGNSNQDYVTAGLTDVIRTQLGQVDPQHLGALVMRPISNIMLTTK